MIGTTLNERFTVNTELGRGGMGIVYRAHDTVLDREVAVKVLSQLSLGTEGREKLLHEAQSIAKLNHPNIVSVHDAGEADGVPFLVMELVDGENLQERPPKDLPELVGVASQVCAALEHAHKNGIVHRDLKPENVLIDSRGSAKLMDFGIARSMASRLTSEGEIIGTVFYVAPETALGHGLDGRADLYSLGVMLYEFATGELPFAHDDPLAVVSQHIHSSVVPPRARNPEVPPLLDSLIMSLLRKQPANRPSSAEEVFELLHQPDLLNPNAEDELALVVLDRIVRGRFVGRERELRDIRSMWNRAAAGDGQTLLLSGEPGIGKTRLMREFATHVEVTGGRSLIGSCYAEGGASYSPFAQILRKALRSWEETENRAAVELPEFVLADVLDIAPELKPHYSDIQPNPKLEPEAQQRRLFENVVSFCAILCLHAPLLLVIEDAHWADSGTLSLFRHMARRLRRKPVMLLATYREVGLEEARPLHEVLLDLNRERLAHRLKLNRFSLGQTKGLLAALFGEDITDEFLEGIYRETEGNPFFVEEVCKVLVEAGQVFLTDDGWDRLSIEALEIPQSIRMAIHERMSRMPEQHQEVLAIAAVLGREFDFATLAAASDIGEGELIRAIEAAERAQLLEEAGNARFSFTHALIQTALTDRVHSLRRRIMHRHAAQAVASLHPMDYGTLAHHFGQAGDRELALDYYIRAGDQAAAAHTNLEAESHYQAALTLAEDELTRANLLSKIGMARASQGRFDDAIHDLDSAISIHLALEDFERAAWCYARAARAAWNGGDHARALTISETGMEILGDETPSAELADLLHETARACHFNGIKDRARQLCNLAIEMAATVGAGQIEAEVLITQEIVEGAPTERSITSLERAIDLAQTHGQPGTEARALANLSIAVTYLNGDIDGGRQHALEAARIAHATGQLPNELTYRGWAAGWAIDQGDFRYARNELKRIRQLTDDLGYGGDAETIQPQQAFLSHYEGDFGAAKKLYRKHMESCRKGGDIQGVYFGGLGYAEMLVEAGDYEEAVLVLQEVIDIDDKLRYTARPHLLLPVAKAGLGEVEDAAKMLAVAEAKFAERPAKYELPYLELARAHVALANGTTAEAEQHFANSVHHAQRIGFRGRLGAFLMAWAQALVDHGESDDVRQAVELLKEALALFREIDAPGYESRVRMNLQALAV